MVCILGALSGDYGRFPNLANPLVEQHIDSDLRKLPLGQISKENLSIQNVAG